MPKMREVKRGKTKTVPAARVYKDVNGVKVTVCKPGPTPKLVTARNKNG